MQQTDRYAHAQHRLAALKGFYIHLAIFLFVMTILLVVNIMNPTVWWVQWPLLGWGAGVLLHWALVFSPAMQWSRNWEKRKLEQLMREE